MMIPKHQLAHQVRLPLVATELGDRREVVIAERHVQEKQFIVRSIPAFIYGLALEDLIEVEDPAAATFKIIKRSGQVTLRVFVKGPLDTLSIRQLVAEVIAAGGRYEVGKNGSEETATSLLLISMNVSTGFKKIEELMESVDAAWEYGNVYGADGDPLNWWSSLEG